MERRGHGSCHGVPAISPGPSEIRASVDWRCFGLGSDRIKTDPRRLDPEHPSDEGSQERRADQNMEQLGRPEIGEQDGK